MTSPDMPLEHWFWSAIKLIRIQGSFPQSSLYSFQEGDLGKVAGILHHVNSAQGEFNKEFEKLPE